MKILIKNNTLQSMFQEASATKMVQYMTIQGDSYHPWYHHYFAAPSLAGLWDQYKLNIIHLYPIFHTHWIIFNLFCSPTPCRVMRFMCIIFNHIPWSVFNIHYSLNQSYSIFIVLYSTYFATPPLAGWWQSLVVEEYGTGICRLPTPVCCNLDLVFDIAQVVFGILVFGVWYFWYLG